MKNLLLLIPNIPHQSVPRGQSDKNNVVIKSWGEKPKFSFKCKNHISLSEDFNP